MALLRNGSTTSMPNSSGLTRNNGRRPALTWIFWKSARSLRKRRRSSKAGWIRKSKAFPSFDYTFARTALARMYHLQGQPERGLRTIEHPDVDAWQFGAMERRALLLDSLGRTAEAEQLAEAALERYPDSINATVLLADLYWKHGKYDSAADLFCASPISNLSSDLAFLSGKTFCRDF